ncbi:hypothetical protein ABEB36_011239 [Hypothenemus hampei]|uniref:Uncharacterized protein n=1 Tax=Hypothenemus hampei TaxID=57062 RepID=A0ABD1EEQ4_HYPHA
MASIVASVVYIDSVTYHSLKCREWRQQLLNLCHNNQERSLQFIVPGDETMVLYHYALSKRESIEWRKPNEQRPRKARQIARKMAIIIWDSQKFMLMGFKERASSANGD